MTRNTLYAIRKYGPNDSVMYKDIDNLLSIKPIEEIELGKLINTNNLFNIRTMIELSRITVIGSTNRFLKARIADLDINRYLNFENNGELDRKLLINVLTPSLMFEKTEFIRAQLSLEEPVDAVQCNTSLSVDMLMEMMSGISNFYYGGYIYINRYYSDKFMIHLEPNFSNYEKFHIHTAHDSVLDMGNFYFSQTLQLQAVYKELYHYSPQFLVFKTSPEISDKFTLSCINKFGGNYFNYRSSDLIFDFGNENDLIRHYKNCKMIVN